MENSNLTLELICRDLHDFVANNILAGGIELHEKTNLNSIGVDSFSLIEIVLFIERQYGIVLTDDTLNPENLKSIETIAVCTLRQLKA